MSDLFILLKASSSLVSDSYYKMNSRFFTEEHLLLFSKKLIQYQMEGRASREPLPYFQEECTPSLENAFSFFSPSLNEWQFGIKPVDELVIEFAKAIEASGIDNLLLLIGQRLTPASIQDSRAIPPMIETLMASASQLYEGNLYVAAREWSKHTNRSPDAFWGKIEGNDNYKNKKALEFIDEILLNKTWWNVFYHFKHEIIYEARLASGHGVRWANDGMEFIGFVEPFINES